MARNVSMRSKLLRWDRRFFVKVHNHLVGISSPLHDYIGTTFCLVLLISLQFPFFFLFKCAGITSAITPTTILTKPFTSSVPKNAKKKQQRLKFVYFKGMSDSCVCPSSIFEIPANIKTSTSHYPTKKECCNVVVATNKKCILKSAVHPCRVMPLPNMPV